MGLPKRSISCEPIILDSTFRFILEYQLPLANGRRFLYINGNHTYRQVKKLGQTSYLRCHVTLCPGSEKLENRTFVIGKPYNYNCGSTAAIGHIGLDVFTKIHGVCDYNDETAIEKRYTLNCDKHIRQKANTLISESIFV